MNTALLISLLLGTSSFSTDCVQSQAQDNGTSLKGYAQDSMAFTGSASNLNVTFSRTWYNDAACTDAQGHQSSETAQAVIGDTFTDSFGNAAHDMNGNAENAADWNFADKSEKGAIVMSADHTTLHIARGFGFGRNSMVGFIGYKAK
jgi:hypothetical protein